ncbi:hypothetical protein A1O3_06938 [Capronia epimyces CBS 606.96]|uniref:RecA family profile 1 domain-containing protein n=1 Tax=Capronia epimyces CBS 606.96 TaxID=1182542 RepID=W9YEB4_9EURO|nr:uncharacterized protein A1O3_06938 [Capronia epimyces CBS 606.96]EXJ80654.1 hypothetical protein A1O3_06938 [Capronia epimyces CBS 606.96]
MEDRGADIDIHNFSASPSQHRLPTVSGIEALQNAAAGAKGIPSGLPALDSLLLPNYLSIATPGIQRGHVTEVFGPPGVGKTTFALQLAVNALRSSSSESHVLWVNTGSPLIEKRIHEILEARHLGDDCDTSSSPPAPFDAETPLEKFMYLESNTLPRLLALFLHPTRTFPSQETCLIVVDDLSNLVLGSFSRNPKSLKPGPPAALREKLEKRAAGRRFQIIESLAAAMSKTAALKKLAVVVLTNATMSLKIGQKATLKPALSSQAWDTAVHTRIILYRDFPDEQQEAEMSEIDATELRYAEIQRLARKDVYRTPVPFVILTRGLQPLTLDMSSSGNQLADETNVADEINDAAGLMTENDVPLLPFELSKQSQSKKRKAIEIADSEDDDDEDDEQDIRSDLDEMQLPRMLRRGGSASNKPEEMILDTHELAILRSYRYASIRGSEDALGISSSSSEGEDETDSEINVHHGEAVR